MSCSSCHMVREGAGGVTYSYAIIGVLCPRCEAQMEYEYEIERRESLTESERIAEDIALRWDAAIARSRYYWPRPGGNRSPF